MPEMPDAACPVCGREMVPGRSINRHHLIPKLKGGKESFLIHLVCHSKLHSLWSEAEFARTYNKRVARATDPRIIDFVAWLANKDPQFVARNRTANARRGPRHRRR